MRCSKCGLFYDDTYESNKCPCGGEIVSEYEYELDKKRRVQEKDDINRKEQYHIIHDEEHHGNNDNRENDNDKNNRMKMLIIVGIVAIIVAVSLFLWRQSIRPNDTGESSTNTVSESSTESTACSHVWNNGKIKKEATCITTGLKTYTCTLCGKTKNKTIAIDSSNHVNTSIVSATVSTCSNNGFSEGVYCNDCQKYISGHVKQPLLAHTLITVNAKTADCTTQGYSGDQVCSVCGKVIQKGHSINALGHTSPNAYGKCTRCKVQLVTITTTTTELPNDPGDAVFE